MSSVEKTWGMGNTNIVIARNLKVDAIVADTSTEMISSAGHYGIFFANIIRVETRLFKLNKAFLRYHSALHLECGVALTTRQGNSSKRRGCRSCV